MHTKLYFKRFQYLLVALALLLGGASCKKLTEKPISFVTPEDFYTTPAQVEATFAASMNTLWSYWGGYGYAMNVFFNDDQYLDGNLVINNNHAADLWNIHYRAIMNLNAAIRAMKAGNLSGIPQADLNVLMAQGKFLRAYNYFMLVRMFGGLPLIDEDTPDPVLNPVTRSSVADVYAQIEADFKEAADNLPRQWPADKRGRPTSGVAKGLLAKAYLTMATAPLNETSNYQKAADYAKQVIDEADYSLVPDIRNVFSLATKYGPEAMWSFNANYADINTDAQIYRPGFMGGWGDIKVQPEWERAVPETPRKEAYILYQLGGVRYEDWPENQWDKYPFVKKFHYDNQDDYDNYSSIMSMPILRFADVLLIYAEAANMANGAPTQAAVDAINEVIDRANDYLPNAGHPLLTTGMTRDAFDEAVIEERNQELCFEYDRWFDLVRKRILRDKSIPSIQQNFTEDDYLFPIPDNDVLLSEGMEQNPGYPLP